MKRVGLTAAAILLAFLSLFMMYSLRLEEKVQLWKKYNVVYFSNDYDLTDITSILSEGGVTGVVSKENSLFSVKNHMLPTLKPYDTDGFTSESMRDFFFHDKSDSYFLLYVPQENIEIAAEVLKNAHVTFGIDASVAYPILCPVLCFASFIMLMAINRVRFGKALCLLPAVAVSYAVPFYSVSAAILCMLFVFCMADMYEKRHGAVHVLLKKKSLWISLIAGITAASFSGKTAILLYFAGLLSSGILLFLRYLIERSRIEDCHFKPVFIINANWLNPEKRYNMKTMLTMLVSCTCFLILSLFSGSVTAGIKTQDLLLPSPSGYTESTGFTAAAYSELSDMHESVRNPDLTDFLNEKWYAETAAYRKVNEPYTTAVADEKVKLPSFREEDGLIVEKDRTVFSFDDAYISYAADDFSNRPGIERLLVSEEGFYSTEYASSGKKEISAFIVPATALCALCFLLLTVVYCIKRHKK